MNRIDESFFRRAPVACARELIGCIFEWDGCSGRIVETEAYAAEGDPACHTFSRPSAREFLDNHNAGTAYVYLNYGVHWLFNILVKGTEGAGFVLLRALEPLTGIAEMSERRGTESLLSLCSGPGKLTQALGIGRETHGEPMLSQNGRGIVLGPCAGVIADPRIGISKAAETPWRFTETGSRFLSKGPSSSLDNPRESSR